MCRTNYSSVSSNPCCTHLTDYKLRFGANPYTHLQDRLKPSPNGKTVVRGDEIETPPRCDLCSGYGGRLYSCLLCSMVSCSSSPNHARSHSESHPGHEIAVDIDRSELYCFACGDQVYDPEFDEIVVSKLLDKMPSRSGRSDRGLMIDGAVGGDGQRKRRRVRFELDLMGSSSHQVGLKRFRDRRSKTVHPLGLRGLNNLGNTCFMNSVLQALLHAPPLRNYFLADRHNRDFCQRRSSSFEKKQQLCLPCDVDGLFSAVFSGDRTPYSPSQFLYSWWLHLDNLANYEQQDAHEFFISILDKIHEKEAKETKIMKDCECIAHRAFSGLLQSDVTCMSCGSTSTTYDPCLDISLDLDTHQDRAPPPVNKSSESSITGECKSISTLSSCLDRFTRPEKLGSNQKLFCEYCQERRDSLKQMSIKHLPLVLCLHIKRFEHSHIRKMSRKINEYLQFPFSLDMAQYLSSTVVRSRYGNRVFALEDDPEASTQYEVFAVVTHSGTLDSGHYVTYLRLSDQWYKCDDAWITEVDESVVRAAQCYMIFYVQKMFYNKQQAGEATTTAFSPQTPQRKDAFLPIAGCC